MSKFQIEVLGDLLIVTAPIAEFFAVYVKPTSEPQLLLKRRTQTDDYVLLAQAWRAANTKARELGWIVYDQPMVRITIALALAAALVIAGALVEFDAFQDQSLLRFLVGAIAVTAGLVWLWSIIKEWRTKVRNR